MLQDTSFLFIKTRIKEAVPPWVIKTYGGTFVNSQIVVSAKSLVEKLFQFASVEEFAHRRFIEQMVAGIIGSQSTLLSNIGRFLNENCRLKHTEKRLSRMLNNIRIPLQELQVRMLELGSFRVQEDAVIAFDPGDIFKKYAKKMDGLYPVWDGSEKKVNNGYELFSTEAVQWKDGKRHHIPLFEKIITAGCEDYVSQNAQVIECVKLVHSYLQGKGIWTFDRGHDRGWLFKELFLKLENFRWVLRVYQNRGVIPVDPKYQNITPNKITPGMMDLAKAIPLEQRSIQLREPKVTAPLRIGYTQLKLYQDNNDQRILTLIVVHDFRNEKPVYLLTGQTISSIEDAAVIFGYYLCRFGIEESFRFRKSYLKLEQLRVLNFRAIQMLHFLVYLSYFFLCLFDFSIGSKILDTYQHLIKHFKPVEDLKFRYYRIAEFVKIRLLEQLKQPYQALIFTPIG